MALLLICPDPSPSSSAQQPGSFSLAPLPKDVAQLSPAAIPVLLSFPAAHLQPPLSWKASFLCPQNLWFGSPPPNASSSFPYSPFGLFWSSLSSHPSKVLYSPGSSFPNSGPVEYYFS